MVFVIWLFYEKAKSTKQMKETTEDFWRQEHQANMTRNTDLSSLSFLTITLDGLPIMDTSDATLSEYQDFIVALSKEKVCDLSAFSNTELKLKYGRANLQLLASYDQNYSNFISVISRWGHYLYDNNYLSQAKTVLEYGIKYNTDIKVNYTLLAQIYKSEGNANAIDSLITKADTLHSLRKDDIKASLMELKIS